MANEPHIVSYSDIPGLVVQSPAMRELVIVVRRAAVAEAPVLLLGEAGSGKQFLASALHHWSPRRDKPFLAVDCAADPEAGFLSRLGQTTAGGAESGTTHDRSSRIEGGTLFLNDLHALTRDAQIRLLRFVQHRKLQGAIHPSSLGLDLRLVSASGCDLYAEVAAGRFRSDLFWALNTIPISMPPLRRRREDIVELAEYFLVEACRAVGRSVMRIAAEASATLQQYSWPGNAHELKNYMERAAALSDSNSVTLESLPGPVRGQTQSEMAVFRGSDTASLIAEIVQTGIASANGSTNDLHARVVNPVERELIVQVMQQCNQVQKKAADRLGINRNTLHKKMKEYGIE